MLFTEAVHTGLSVKMNLSLFYSGFRLVTIRLQQHLEASEFLLLRKEHFRIKINVKSRYYE